MHDIYAELFLKNCRGVFSLFLKCSCFEEYYINKMLNENLLKDDNIGTKSMGKNQIFQYIQDFDVENHQ